MLVVSAVILAVTLQVAGRAASQLHGRTTTDICANVNGLLEVPEKFAGTVPVGLISKFIACSRSLTWADEQQNQDQCFCLSEIPSMLTSNAVAIAAVVDSSQTAASSALTSMVCSHVVLAT